MVTDATTPLLVVLAVLAAVVLLGAFRHRIGRAAASLVPARTPRAARAESPTLRLPHVVLLDDLALAAG